MVIQTSDLFIQWKKPTELDLMIDTVEDKTAWRPWSSYRIDIRQKDEEWHSNDFLTDELSYNIAVPILMEEPF